MRIRAYLDNNATTRIAPSVLAAMMPYLTDCFLNPASAAGELLGAGRALDDVQVALAGLFGSRDLAGRFVLTSGASESNSWAVRAAALLQPRHWVCGAIEHPSLLAAAEAARDGVGVQLTLALPEATGRISPDTFLNSVRPDTGFVSLMAANSETGVIQPVAEVARAVRSISPGALIHVDATQAVGRVDIDLDDAWAEVDLMSLSAHKMHGPKGMGALYVRDGIDLPALIYGSKSAHARGGTPNGPGAAGLAAAAFLAADNLQKMVKVKAMRDAFEADIVATLPNARINGQNVDRLPNTASISIPGLDAAAAVEHLALEGICLATGSACTSGSIAPSHVLTAMGLDYEMAKATIRVSLSIDNTREELQLALERIVDCAA